MESKQFLFLPCVIAALIVSSVSIEMKADHCMKKQRPFVIACDVGQITQEVSFYNNKEKLVSCVPPGHPCDTVATACSLSKDNSTALLVIDAVDCKKDSGDWYCGHGTQNSSKFKMDCSQCGHCEAFAAVTTAISCILVVCDCVMVVLNIIMCCRRCYKCKDCYLFARVTGGISCVLMLCGLAMVILNIIICCSSPEGKLAQLQEKKWFKSLCFVMEMASVIMGTIGATGLAMYCEMEEGMMKFGMTIDGLSTFVGFGLMIFEFAKSLCGQNSEK